MRLALSVLALTLTLGSAAQAQKSPQNPLPFSLPGPEQVGEEIRALYVSVEGQGGVTAGASALVWSQTLTMPGASYIAPHFKSVDLPPGAELVVRAPDFARSWTYRGKGKEGLPAGEGFWGIHIHGDTAILEIYSKEPVKEGAVVVDSYAHGYPVVGRQPESVCGGDDSVEAKCLQSSQPAAYNESRAVARLLINGTGLCTGWLLGNQGHLMTNNHCIGNSSSALNTNYEFLAEGASCATNCQSALGCPGTVVATSATFVQTDFNLDYTLVRLPTNPTGTYGFMQLRSSGAVLGERIYLPGHPAGWGKRIASASTHTQNPSGFCEVDSLNEAACQGGSAPEVGYYCDTRGGSSGSPVLATSDNCVVALHHCRGSIACTSTGGNANRGVRVPSIISDLGANLPGGALCGSGSSTSYQVGSVTHDEVIRTVTLTGVSNPIVVLGPPSFGGGDPSTTRVRNVSAASFQHNLQEWDYLDGGHVNETIGYLAVSAGPGSLGVLDIDAGSRSVNHNWVTVNFGQSFGSAPVVIAQVASFNGSQAVTTRVRNVTATGFEVRLQEEEGNDGTHANETVHWFAIETGTTTVGGKRVSATRTGNSVTHTFAPISFGSTLSNPVFLAEMQTFDGSDPAALRHQSLTTTGVQVKVEEEASADTETNHATEVVGWVVIEP